MNEFVWNRKFYASDILFLGRRASDYKFQMAVGVETVAPFGAGSDIMNSKHTHIFGVIRRFLLISGYYGGLNVVETGALHLGYFPAFWGDVDAYLVFRMYPIRCCHSGKIKKGSTYSSKSVVN